MEPLVGQVYREIVQVQNLIKTIEGKIDAVETRVAQLDKLMLQKIDQNIADMTSAVETRIDKLEQLMQREAGGIVAKLTVEVRDLHAQQTRLLRLSFALVFALVVGIQWTIWMLGWMGENRTTCLRPLVAYGRLHCQVIDDGPSDVEHIADGMKALWNYTQHFNYSEWVTKFNTPP